MRDSIVVQMRSLCTLLCVDAYHQQKRHQQFTLGLPERPKAERLATDKYRYNSCILLARSVLDVVVYLSK